MQIPAPARKELEGIEARMQVAVRELEQLRQRREDLQGWLDAGVELGILDSPNGHGPKEDEPAQEPAQEQGPSDQVGKPEATPRKDELAGMIATAAARAPKKKKGVPSPHVGQTRDEALRKIEERSALVLGYVQRNPDVASGDVARGLGINQSLVVSSLKRLEEQGKVLQTGAKSTSRWHPRAAEPLTGKLAAAPTATQDPSLGGKILAWLELHQPASARDVHMHMRGDYPIVIAELEKLVREGHARKRSDGRFEATT